MCILIFRTFFFFFFFLVFSGLHPGPMEVPRLGAHQSCSFTTATATRWDPALLWLWHRPVATVPIPPLAWEPPYATGAALENGKKTINK